MVSAIAAHIKRNVSVENGLQIFCLGQGYPGLGLQEAATDAICSAKDSTLTACLFARCGYDNVAEQLVVVKGLAAHKSLVEVGFGAAYVLHIWGLLHLARRGARPTSQRYTHLHTQKI